MRLLCETDSLLLELIIKYPDIGLTELVKKLDGIVKRGTVYNLVIRLEAAMLISSRYENDSDQPDKYTLPTKHVSITEIGKKIYYVHLEHFRILNKSKIECEKQTVSVSK